MRFSLKKMSKTSGTASSWVLCTFYANHCLVQSEDGTRWSRMQV